MVAVLEPQIDLLGRHVHKGDVLEVLSDTNDENHTSETSGLETKRVRSFGDGPVILMGLTYVDSCMDTALHTSTFKNQLRLLSELLDDTSAQILWGFLLLN